jgi:hypothetical protein
VLMIGILGAVFYLVTWRMMRRMQVSA